ncbi:fructosamine kinase family protein [Thiomonas sp.]
MNPTTTPLLSEVLRRTLGHRHWQVRALHASGFCETWSVDDGVSRGFLKSASGPAAATLHAEADGLRALADTHTIDVPGVLWLETDAPSGLTLLGLEWLDLRAGGAGYGARFGRAMAALHVAALPALPGAARYGWARDNWLGATPQCNAPEMDWVTFFSRHRLGALSERLMQTRPEQAALCDAVQAVIDRWQALFDDGHEPRPSLLHGDLWSAPRPAAARQAPRGG